MHKSSKAFSFISLIFAAFTGIFVSCSQNTPELYNTDYSVIFDYADDETPPVARLSIFAASETDVRRYQRIKIKSVESDYYWDTEQLSKLETEDSKWAGCTNIVPPQDEKLPVGTYEVTYYNADEKEYSLTIDVRYDIDFYDVLLPALPDFMADKKGVEKIAVYDKEHILIYFGDRTQELKTTRDIWNRYRDASTYQVIWYTVNRNVICITPEKPVTPEADNTQEEN